jgi:hypothetical protein
MGCYDRHTTQTCPPIPPDHQMQAWATQERARIDRAHPRGAHIGPIALIPNQDLIRNHELAMVDQTLRYARYVRANPGRLIGRGRNYTWAYEYNTIARMDEPWHVHARHLAERGGIDGVRGHPGGG